VLDVAYVGNHGVRVPVAIDLNAAQAPSLCGPLCNAFGRLAATTLLFKRTTSNYNALQVKFDHKWSSGFLITTAYTWGKALNYRPNAGSDDGGVVYPVTSGPFANFQRNYMNSSRNRTHTFVQSYVYELPFGKGKPWIKSGVGQWVLGGWQISGIMTIMSGTPLDFNAGGLSLAMSGTRQTPIQIAPFTVLGGIGTNAFWFDTSAFCPVVNSPLPTTLPNGVPVAAGCAVNGNGTPAINGQLGNVRRYSFAGPRFFNLDAGLFRRVTLTERLGMELRAQAYGLTNTPHFDNPNADITSANFGRITRTMTSDGGSRSAELAAKITF
jgi:hypothetical protein